MKIFTSPVYNIITVESFSEIRLLIFCSYSHKKSSYSHTYSDDLCSELYLKTPITQILLVTLV